MKRIVAVGLVVLGMCSGDVAGARDVRVSQEEQTVICAASVVLADTVQRIRNRFMGEEVGRLAIDQFRQNNGNDYDYLREVIAYYMQLWVKEVWRDRADYPRSARVNGVAEHCLATFQVGERQPRRPAPE